jgi:hypothetical protein
VIPRLLGWPSAKERACQLCPAPATPSSRPLTAPRQLTVVIDLGMPVAVALERGRGRNRRQQLCGCPCCSTSGPLCTYHIRSLAVRPDNSEPALPSKCSSLSPIMRAPQASDVVALGGTIVVRLSRQSRHQGARLQLEKGHPRHAEGHYEIASVCPPSSTARPLRPIHSPIGRMASTALLATPYAPIGWISGSIALFGGGCN